LSAQVGRATGSDATTFKAQLDSMAATASGGGRGRGGAAASGPPASLDAASASALSAAMAMQSADVAPTAAQVRAATDAHANAAAMLARWTRLRTTGLAALNAKLKAAGQPPVQR
jgi:hypothetical protein